jgi:predicted transcriptional regulator
MEQYLSILEALVCRPLEFEVILYQVDQEWPIIKKHLDFLVSNGLVEKLPLDAKRIVYAITDRGSLVLKGLRGQEYLEEHEHLLLVYEE